MYVLAVTKAGSGEEANWVFFDPEAGDVVTAQDGKEISHLILCTVKKTTPTPEHADHADTPTTPTTPTGPVVETDRVADTGSSTGLGILAAGALIAGAGALFLASSSGRPPLMRRRPLLAVGLGLTVLAVALLIWVMQRGGESVGSAYDCDGVGHESPRPHSKPSPLSRKARLRNCSGSRPSVSTRRCTVRVSAPTARSILSPVRSCGSRGSREFDPERSVPRSSLATSRPVTSRDVFAELADVDVGDKVQSAENGKVIAYRVVRASAIDKVEVTSDPAVWGLNASGSRLAIITCDDAFGFRGDGHRVANYVVIAERV